MNTYTLTQAQLNDCVFCDGFAHNLLVSLKPNSQEPVAIVKLDAPMGLHVPAGKTIRHGMELFDHPALQYDGELPPLPDIGSAIEYTATELQNYARQAISNPVNDFVEACGRYEAALMAAFPQGAHGEAFEQWNEARKALAKRDDKAANVKGAQR